MSETVLALNNVCKTFTVGAKTVQAVRDVSLFVGENEAVGLVGESGCGKSTLARLITRIETPDSGTVSLCGKDTTRIRGASLRRSYADMKMIFQEPRSSFDPRLTLGASIKQTLRAAGIPRREQDRTVKQLLREVGLDESYAGAKPMDVSGGECQRAAIARAVATKPRLLICDEATSALDVSVQAQIMELLGQLRCRHEMSFLFISHDLALVSSFCERTYVMSNGEIVECGRTMDVTTSPQNEYTKALIASVLPA